VYSVGQFAPIVIKLSVDAGTVISHPSPETDVVELEVEELLVATQAVSSVHWIVPNCPFAAHCLVGLCPDVHPAVPQSPV
jgi:hypothetical protein